jgi:hypothetical protein
MRGHEASMRDNASGRVSTLVASEERGFYRTSWLCEKWSEDAVEFTRRALEREGVSHIQDGYEVKPSGMRDKIASAVAGHDVSRSILVPRLIPIEHGITSEMLRKYVGDPEVVEEIEGNLLLNEGIARLIALLIGAGGTAFNNANAYVGVGDAATAEAQTQTELQAATNRFYKASVGGYPLTPGSGSPAANSVDFRSDFTTTEANYVWNEWSVSAGATTASGAGFTAGTTNLNRKVQSLGTKATGTWTMTGTITFS